MSSLCGVHDDFAWYGPVRFERIAEPDADLLQFLRCEDTVRQPVSPVVFQSVEALLIEDGDLVEDDRVRLAGQAADDLLDRRFCILQDA